MPRDYRNSYSRSPRRSRTRSPYRERHRNDYGDRYRDDRRRGGGGYGRDRDRYDDRDRDRDRSMDRRNDEIDQSRIHIADLNDSVTQYDIEKAFMKFGEIKEVWMAKNPPCFAFVVYKNKQDASSAVKEMDQKTLGYNRVRVTFARPRTRGRKRRWDPNMRCYQCGERGHFSRDCDGGGSRRRHDRSYSRGRNKRSSRSRSRSRSYSRNTRSRTPKRDFRNNNMNGSNGALSDLNHA